MILVDCDTGKINDIKCNMMAFATHENGDPLLRTQGSNLQFVMSTGNC